MPFHVPQEVLLILQAAAAAFAAARLLQFHLQQRFPLLFFYLIVSLIVDTALSLLVRNSSAYLWVFLIGSVATWCAECLAVFEMLRLIFRDFPGLRTVGKWAVYAAAGVSVTILLLAFAMPSQEGSPLTRLLSYELIADRSEHFILAIVIVFLMACLSRYPLRLDRNVYVASGFFSVVFLVQFAVRLIDSLSEHLYADVVDQPEIAFTALCFPAWGVMLRDTKATVPERVPVSLPREAELLQQLDAMNALLSRSVRR